MIIDEDFDKFPHVLSIKMEGRKRVYRESLFLLYTPLRRYIRVVIPRHGYSSDIPNFPESFNNKIQ